LSLVLTITAIKSTISDENSEKGWCLQIEDSVHSIPDARNGFGDAVLMYHNSVYPGFRIEEEQ
jgi:hypothetical protein